MGGGSYWKLNKLLIFYALMVHCSIDRSSDDELIMNLRRESDDELIMNLANSDDELIVNLKSTNLRTADKCVSCALDVAAYSDVPQCAIGLALGLIFWIGALCIFSFF